MRTVVKYNRYKPQGVGYLRKRTGSLYAKRQAAARRRTYWDPGYAPFGKMSRARSIALANVRTGGLLGIEKKFLDNGISNFAIPAAMTGAEVPNTAATGCFSAPAQGDGASNRDGNRIVIVECNAQGVIVVPSQADVIAADTACYVFIALVQDTQSNGVQLNSEDVITNPSTQAAAAADPFRNMSYTKRFRLLGWTKKALRIPFMTYDGTNIEQSGFHTPWKIKWRGKMPVTFTTASTTSDIANVTDNSIQMIATCSNTTLAPALYGNVRTRFYG